MINVRPFEWKDKSQIFELLGALNPNMANKQWDLLFTYKWENNAQIKGMVIEDNSIIKGFICFVGSVDKNREITFSIVNLSSWIVKEKYRKQSLKMLLPLFKEKTFILNLTPKENIVHIYETLGFKTFAKFDYYINPIKFFLKTKKKTQQQNYFKFKIINC